MGKCDDTYFPIQMSHTSSPKKTRKRGLFTVLAVFVLGYALVVGALGLVGTMSIATFLSVTLF